MRAGSSRDWCHETSDPSSCSFGKYPSLSTLQSKYGASSSKRNAVVNAFKSNGITATVDVTHHRRRDALAAQFGQQLARTGFDLATGAGSPIANVAANLHR